MTDSGGVEAEGRKKSVSGDIQYVRIQEEMCRVLKPEETRNWVGGVLGERLLGQNRRW
jgi:hypothetical protein